MEQFSQALFTDRLKFILKVLEIVGVGRPIKYRKLYYFYQLVVGLCIDFVKWATQIPYLVANIQNIMLIAATLYTFATNSACLIKKYSTLRNFGRIMDIVKSLDRDIFLPQNSAHQDIMNKEARKFATLYKMFCSSAMCIPLLMCSVPILDTTEKRLPLRCWIDHFVAESNWYWFFYIYQAVGIVMDVLVGLNADFMAVGLFMFLGIQCDYLKQLLENVYEIALEKSSISGRPIEVEMNKLMRHCIIQHNAILELKKRIESLYDFSIVLQFGCSVITYCTTLFQLSEVDIFSLDFVWLVEYQITLSVQLFLYCWFGNEVTLKGGEIPMAAYMGNWMYGDEPFKKSLIILICNAQTPLQIYVGGIFATSLETFMKAFQSAFSYYTVLDNFDQ